MRLLQASDLVALLAAGLLLPSVLMSVLHGEEPAPPAAVPVAEPAAVVKIAGTVESLDDKVVEIVTTGDIEPKVGDAFEVFVTPPNGERGRVGRGKISFAKKGVVLGRLEEATGEIAAGLEVSIQSSKPQRRAAATVTPAPAEPAAAEPPVPADSTPTDSTPDDSVPDDSAPADAALAVSIEKLPGLFIGDDPRFPFVLQVETRGDVTVVRGLGRMAYSADDPTLIMAEFVGMSVAGDQPTLRGVLALQPDGERLTEPKLSPLFGLYDSVRDDWQMMLSPQHVISASRPGVAAMRGNDSASTNDGALTIDHLVAASNKLEQVLRSNPKTNDQIAALNQMQTDAQAAAAQAHADLPTDVRASLAATRASLGANWNQATTTLVGLGERMSKTAPATHSQSSVNPPGLDNADAALYVQVAMARFWYLNDHRFVNRTMRQVELQDTRSAPPAPINASGVTRWRSFVHETFLLPIYGPTNVAAAAVTRTPQAPAGAASPPPRATPTGTTPAAPGSPSSPSSTAPVAPPNPADTAAALTMPLDDVQAFLWAVGISPDRISYTLMPAPEPARAWQVVRINRLPGGRIEIVNYGNAPDGPDVAQGGAGTRPGGSAPTAPPNSTGASTGRTGAGSTGGTGTTPSGSGGTRNPDGTTRVVNADGSNRVPGSPPTKPPAGPGGVKPPQWAPAPPVPTIPPLTPGRSVTQTPSTRRGDGTVYDPNITILVDEDSTAADAARMAAARAALDRARAAGGVPVKDPLSAADQALAAARRAAARTAAAARADALNRAGDVQTALKGPKAAGGDQHHEAPGPKPDDKKKHSIAGTWEMTSKHEGLISSQLTITVTGRAVRFQGTTINTAGNGTWSSDGTIAEGDKGTRVANITITANSVGAPAHTGTSTLSEDGSTITFTFNDASTTWRRVK